MRNIASYVRELGNHHTLVSVTNDLNGSSDLARDFLRRLWLILRHDRVYTKRFLDNVEENTLRTWLERPPTTSSQFQVLAQLELLPTPEVWRVAHQSDAKSTLEARIAAIDAGGFQRDNLIDIEIEYARSFGKTREVFAWEDFQQLPWIERMSVAPPVQFKRDLNATVEEAIAVFKIIEQKKREQPDIPLLVIGNKRYGWNYVVTPLREHLQRLGVDVESEYSRSTHYFEHPNHEGGLDYKLREKILAEKPHIVVVDGTVIPCDGDFARFPAAMWGYINAFHPYKELTEREEQSKSWIVPPPPEDTSSFAIEHSYQIRFVSPYSTERVIVGECEYPQRVNPHAERELIIVCSTSSSYDGSGACFDNIEKNKTRKGYGFCRTGFTERPVYQEIKDFVLFIQERMKEEIDQRLA